MPPPGFVAGVETHAGAQRFEAVPHVEPPDAAKTLWSNATFEQ
jgi:hypothetical protein